MPQPITDVTYTRNTIRVTLRTYNWADLQTSAEHIEASVYKVEGKSLVPLPEHQKLQVDGTQFVEATTGEYQLFIHTNTLSAGEYRVVFSADIDGSHVYQPVKVKFKTLKSEVAA